MAYTRFAKEVMRVSTLLGKNQEHQSDFCLFSQESLMLSTDEFNEDFVHTMVGYAVWIKGMKMPRKLVGEGHKPQSK